MLENFYELTDWQMADLGCSVVPHDFLISAFVRKDKGLRIFEVSSF